MDVSNLDRAYHLAITRLHEEHLYFALLQQRWIRPENAALTRDAFFGRLPKPLRGFIFSRVKKSMGKLLHRQGMGRHSEAEIDAFALEDITAI